MGYEHLTNQHLVVRLCGAPGKAEPWPQMLGILGETRSMMGGALVGGACEQRAGGSGEPAGKACWRR